jgi:hypothetical protein
VPYENRVAKPTAPELQVKKKKNYIATYKTAATRTCRYAREPFMWTVQWGGFITALATG